MPHQNLPKELEEDDKAFKDWWFCRVLEQERKNCTPDIESLCQGAYQEGLAQGKAAGYKDGILAAMEMIPQRRDYPTAMNSKRAYDEYIGHEDCRRELLSRLEERLKRIDSVQE